MKILAICHRAYYGLTPAGGAEMMLHRLLAHLVTQGWEAEAIVLGKNTPEITVDGVTVKQRRGERHLKQAAVEADVIITYLGATMLAKKTGLLTRKPVVQVMHNTNKHSEAFLGSGCDLAIYNAEWVKIHHENARGEIMFEWQNRKNTSLRQRKSNEWPGIVVRPPTITHPVKPHLGRDGYITLVNLVDNKGPDVFYDLAEQNPDLKFLGVIGGYQPECQVIREMPNVTIIDHTAVIDSFYRDTSVVLMPSRYESYGMVAIEAIGRGIPAIVTPTPGLKESMGPNGFFADRDIPGDWNRVLHHVLDNYAAASASSYSRALELEKQSAVELAAFESRLQKLVESWDSSLSMTSN